MGCHLFVHHSIRPEGQLEEGGYFFRLGKHLTHIHDLQILVRTHSQGGKDSLMTELK